MGFFGCGDPQPPTVLRLPPVEVQIESSNYAWSNERLKYEKKSGTNGTRRIRENRTDSDTVSLSSNPSPPTNLLYRKSKSVRGVEHVLTPLRSKNRRTKTGLSLDHSAALSAPEIERPAIWGRLSRRRQTCVWQNKKAHPCSLRVSIEVCKILPE